MGELPACLSFCRTSNRHVSQGSDLPSPPAHTHGAPSLLQARIWCKLTPIAMVSLNSQVLKGKYCLKKKKSALYGTTDTEKNLDGFSWCWLWEQPTRSCPRRGCCLTALSDIGSAPEQRCLQCQHFCNRKLDVLLQGSQSLQIIKYNK